MSSKSLYSSGLSENVWSSPYVMIHFGYPACCIQSPADGSQGFSWARWNAVERKEIFCTEGGFCMVLGSLPHQLLGICCTSSTFPAATMLLLRARSHRGIKSRPNVCKNINEHTSNEPRRREYKRGPECNTFIISLVAKI